MKYWLDLFTGTTWDEFLSHGAKVSGFRERRRRTAEQIHPGDLKDREENAGVEDKRED